MNAVRGNECAVDTLRHFLVLVEKEIAGAPNGELDGYLHAKLAAVRMLRRVDVGQSAPPRGGRGSE